MSEDEAPSTEIVETIEPDEATEAWVTGANGSAERAPGIDDVPETTYVEPQPDYRRRAVLIGLAVGLGVTAIFAAIVFSADSSGEPRESTVRPDRVSETTSSTTSTTSVTASGTDTPGETSAPAAAPVAPPSTTATVAPVVPTPRATSDPAAPGYIAAPLPPGLSGTMAACSWQQTNGGQYEASGTVTSTDTTAHSWTLTIHWLQNGREIAQQSGSVDLAAGQTLPWSLALSAPIPPADPFSCALSAA